MKLMMTLNNKELNDLQFSVIVEMWDRMKSSMNKRRKYNEAFTEEERNTISKYHTMFRNWHLINGTPEEKTMPLKTLILLKRALDFFARL